MLSIATRFNFIPEVLTRMVLYHTYNMSEMSQHFVYSTFIY